MHIHTSISIFIQKLKSKPKTIENFYKNQTSISNITQPEPDMEHIQKVQYILFAEKPSHL